jgi:hypothetical protein
MKYLTNYIEEAQTKAFNEAGAFFAFSDKQFNEAKVEGVKYLSLGAGLICPGNKAKQLIATLDKVHAEGIKQDLAENGKAGVIHRELGNHEYSITYSIEDTARALEGYGITREEIQAEGKVYLKAHYEWEEAEELKKAEVSA